jgi:hypothetical protein
VKPKRNTLRSDFSAVIDGGKAANEQLAISNEQWEDVWANVPN